jgi:hypothetical protein
MGPPALERNAVRDLRFSIFDFRFMALSLANSAAPILKLVYRTSSIRERPKARRKRDLMLGFLGFCGAWMLGFGVFGNATASPGGSQDRPSVVLIVGAPGEAEYGSNFLHQAELWEKACAQGECTHVAIGLGPAARTNDYELLKQTLDAEPKDGAGPLWLVFIGHGTFDGKEARFNLRGPDVCASELALWFKPFHRPLAVINTASSSAPFLNLLSATNRVIITATRSGSERNFTRFGQYFAEALTNPEADLDKDGQISLLEAFLTASRQAADFYKIEGRIVTEHALLDDNGDGLGTPADWFTGLRATKRAKDKAALDGLLANQFHLGLSDEERKWTPNQRARRDSLERAVLLQREKRAQMNEEEYYRQLERLLLELARLYDSVSPEK